LSACAHWDQAAQERGAEHGSAHNTSQCEKNLASKQTTSVPVRSDGLGQENRRGARGKKRETRRIVPVDDEKREMSRNFPGWAQLEKSRDGGGRFEENACDRDEQLQEEDLLCLVFAQRRTTGRTRRAVRMPGKVGVDDTLPVMMRIVIVEMCVNERSIERRSFDGDHHAKREELPTHRLIVG
jgi:hypothetical protein